MPFDNETGEPRLYWLSEGAAVALTDDLDALGAEAISREDRLLAFDGLRLPPVAALSHATVIRVGQVVGAMQVVIGAFELRGDDELVVRARAIRLDTGRLFPEVVETGPLADVFDVFARVARRLLPDSRVPLEQMEEAHPPLPAFEAYIKGVLAETPATQVTFLNQAVRLAPGFQRARLALWEVHTAEGEHRRALDIVGEVPAGHRSARRARFLAGLSRINLREYQQATEALQALNGEQPDPAILTALGVAQLRRPAGVATGLRAVTFFEDAARLDPSDPDLHFNLGYAAYLDRDMDDAIASLREAVRRNPADDAAHYVLGVALQATGANAEGAREKELARRLSSTYAEWEAQQGGVNAAPRGLERMKIRLDAAGTPRVEDALVATGQRDQRELAAFHLESGRRLFEAGRDADAIGELRRAIYLAPYDSTAHLLLGRAYLRGGRTAEAIDALKIAVWADPNNREAQDLLATIPVP
ncbi:MAG: tetratricopeptide repeat protein [Vicinamibacterales bacterium]